MNNKNVWSTEVEYVENCGKCDGQFIVMLSNDVKIKISILMEKFPSLEWLAYMTGTIDFNNKKAIAKDLIIPEQEVGVSKVFDIQPVNEKTIGVIHSHHNMGNFFSADDKETINKNNDISLVVTHEKITGQVRIKTDCGCYLNMTANVVDYIETNVNKEEWLNEINGRIKERYNDYQFEDEEDEYIDTDEYYDDVDKILTYEDLLNNDENILDQLSLSEDDLKIMSKRYNGFAG